VSKQERQKRYRTVGAAANLVKVETLVPPEGRDDILRLAARLRRRARRQAARSSRLDVSAILHRIAELNELQRRRYSVQPSTDNLVVTSVNVPFPVHINAESLAEALQSGDIPVQYRPHLERFIGEIPQVLLLRFSDRHSISAEKLRSFVAKNRSLLGLNRPELEEHLDALVPNS
jgi:hypothetical protein